MPKFQNTLKSPIDLIHNGRKIRIEPNSIIEGPQNFIMYNGLKLLEEAKTINKKDIKIDRTMIYNMNKQREIKAEPPRKTNLFSKIYSNEPLISIPRSIVISENFDKTQEIDAAKKVTEEYTTLPSIGICILTKNSLGLIKDCCESIFDKVNYKNTKLYIFDTGTDSQEVMDYYETLKNRKFPVSIISVGNFHFSSNYNVGIQQVDTDYVLIQNNDTIALNDYITKLMKIATIDKVGLSGPRMLYKEGTIQHDGQHLYQKDPANSNNIIFANPGHLNLGAHPSQVKGGRDIVDGITAAGVLLKTSWFKSLGGFDAGFKDIYQDVHFCMKNRMYGKVSVCDKEAQIIHYDNTSRKQNWKIDEMRQDHNYLFSKIHTGEVVLKSKNKRTFSIITVVNNKEQYTNFLNDISKQDFTGSFEIIPLLNFDNNYKSCSEALNIGLDITESEYSILCHQDLRLPTNWLSKIYSHINNLDKVKWGVLGMSGCMKTSPTTDIGTTYLDNLLDDKNPNSRSNADHFRQVYGPIQEIHTLDELCLIVKSGNHIRFDENTFNHYHWYGADICLNYVSQGYKNFAIDASCFHISDGISNFFKESHIDNFIQGSAKLYMKWKNQFPFFRTTTTSFSTLKQGEAIFGLAQYLFADTLINKGVSFPKAIKIE